MNGKYHLGHRTSATQCGGGGISTLDRSGTSALVLIPLAHMANGGWELGWGAAMMAVMVLFWASVIIGGVLLVRHLVRERGSGTSGDRGRADALGALERRFAEGEIGADEYRERRSILEEGR